MLRWPVAELRDRAIEREMEVRARAIAKEQKSSEQKRKRQARTCRHSCMKASFQIIPSSVCHFVRAESRKPSRARGKQFESRILSRVEGKSNGKGNREGAIRLGPCSTQRLCSGAVPTQLPLPNLSHCAFCSHAHTNTQATLGCSRLVMLINSSHCAILSHTRKQAKAQVSDQEK